MSTEPTSSKSAAGRAPDNRFRYNSNASEKRSALKKIDVSSMQLDNSFDGDGDPYNNTGRYLKPAFKDR